METSSFGILNEMKRYDNSEMTEEEQIDFIQLLIDMDMIWIMSPSWVHRAKDYLADGRCVHQDQFVCSDGTIAKTED